VVVVVQACLRERGVIELVKVSVVIPCFNHHKELERTLTALTVQSYPLSQFEVLVVDDGSDPPLNESISDFESSPIIRYFRQSRKGYRLATARNRGIREAAGSTIVSLDADMLPVPELIEEHLCNLPEGEQAATIGYRRHIDASAVTLDLVRESFDDIRRLPDIPSVSNYGRAMDRRLPELENFADHPAPYNCFHAGNVAFRKCDALQVGLFDEQFNGYWGYEDIEFAYRLWRFGVRFLLAPKALAFHQENSVFTLEYRLHGAAVNFELACRKIPGFREFRHSIRRVPGKSVH